MMKSKGLLLILLCFATGCGQHSQSLSRVLSSQPVKEISETDRELILINAANRGDLSKVIEMVESGVDINTRSNEGLTIIMIAIRAQQFAVIEYLMEKEVDLELMTDSREYNPAVNAREFFEKMAFPQDIENIVGSLLEKVTLTPEDLNSSLYTGIDHLNVGLFSWLLNRGANPNDLRLSDNGKPKDTPLIALLSLRGMEGERFEKVKQIFELLLNHPDIDVNLKARKRDSPLSKAKSRLEDDSAYLPMVERLISMGAVD